MANELEKLLKVVANRRRLFILNYLLHTKEENVKTIAQKLGLSIKATSRHLGQLFRADLLLKEQRVLKVYYRLNDANRIKIKTILRLR